MVTPLGGEMLIIAGKSANKSVSTSTLAYDNRAMEDVGKLDGEARVVSRVIHRPWDVWQSTTICSTLVDKTI
jgi:hypothetical protein